MKDDTEEILGIRTTHGQLPLIHMPYRHFLSLSTLTKLLVWRRDKGYTYRKRGGEREDEFAGTTRAVRGMDTNRYIEGDNVLFDTLLPSGRKGR